MIKLVKKSSLEKCFFCDDCEKEIKHFEKRNVCKGCGKIICKSKKCSHAITPTITDFLFKEYYCNSCYNILKEVLEKLEKVNKVLIKTLLAFTKVRNNIPKFKA